MKKIYIRILRELNVLDELSLKTGEKNLKNIVLNFLLALIYTVLIKMGEWLIYLFAFSPMYAFELEPFVYYNTVMAIVDSIFWVLDMSKASYMHFIIGFWVGIFKGYFYIFCVLAILTTLISLGYDYRFFIPQNIIDIGLLLLFYISIVLNGFRTAIDTVKCVRNEL